MRKYPIAKVPPTRAQRWAQERNWTKAMWVGIRSSLYVTYHKSSTTKAEKQKLLFLIEDIGNIIKGFKLRETESKQIYMEKERK